MYLENVGTSLMMDILWNMNSLHREWRICFWIARNTCRKLECIVFFSRNWSKMQTSTDQLSYIFCGSHSQDNKWHFPQESKNMFSSVRSRNPDPGQDWIWPDPGCEHFYSLLPNIYESHERSFWRTRESETVPKVWKMLENSQTS